MLKLGKATFDWVHGLQVFLAVSSTVAGYFASHASSLPLGITSGTCGLAALVIGLVYKSIFHVDIPPSAFNGGHGPEAPTKPDIPSVPPARNVSTTGPIGVHRITWAPQPPRPIAGMMIAAMLLMALFLLPRCQNGQVSFPVALNIVEVVANDIAAGDTEAQLASDVCKTLGGSSTTDAICADVADVIANAVGLLLKDPKFPAALKLRALVMQTHLKAGTFAK
jgi:hypothetical protein